MYGFTFHDANNHEPIEKIYETFQSCLEAMDNPFFEDYSWPFGIDLVNEDDGFVVVIISNIIQFKELKEIKNLKEKRK